MASETRRDLSRPVIGVTGNGKRFSPSWFCIRISVRLAGGIPRRISTRHSLEISSLDGIVISGGDDIHPSLYKGDEAPKAHYDRDRDELEQRHIRYALRRGIPLLGICRGYQLINVTCGGSLHGDIRNMRRNTSNYGTILPRKTINAKPDSLISRLIGRQRFKVNSLHHQAIDRLAEGFRVTGRDLDEMIQSIEASDNRRILGVQWHPEYLLYLSSQRRLFRWLVENAARRRKESGS